MPTALKIENVVVDFMGFKAINGISMEVDEGELRVIIGPNGAGKTTLMDLITGKTAPSLGKISFNGKAITGKSIHSIAADYGIGRKFQGPNLFDNMSVWDNLEISLAGFSTALKTLFYHKTREIKSKIEETLKIINLYEEKDEFACNLSHGQRQWLEIGMVMMQSPKLIIFDEPTAGMTADETYKTGKMIKNLQGKHTILVVEHDMDFVKQVAEKVSVLHMGKMFAEGTFDEISNNEKVIQIYLKDEENEA